jgi:NOL1/NOP2/fmu family ribosome biogenesis protein
MSDEDDGSATDENLSDRFERLPATAADRSVPGRPTREAVLEWWEERFGIEPDTFESFTFWEKGAGRVWALHHDLAGPVAVEALGLPVLRTRQEFWKPTTDAVQRFGRLASKNVIELDADQARRFVAGEDQDLDWDGDWGYLVAAHDIAGAIEPIGVGLFTYGTLQSMVPKGRRREF